MSLFNKNITRKVPTKIKILVRTGSLRQPALFKEILATNSKTLVRIGTGTRDISYIKTEENGGFCEEVLSENDFEAVLVTFCCYGYDANASEAVQKVATDQKDYHKCS